MPPPFSFRKYLLLSGLTHAGAFLLLLLFSLISWSSRSLFVEKVTWVDLPSSFVKAKDLPQSTLEEQKKAFTSEPIPPPKKEEKVVQLPPKKKPPPPPKKKEPPKKEVEKIDPSEELIQKALEQVEQNLQDRKEIRPEAAQIEENPDNPHFGPSNGEMVSRLDPEYMRYQMTVRRKIMDQWIVPLTLQDGHSLCEIIVRINEKGELVSLEWQKKSESEALNLSAQRAIERAAPLDIPPTRLQYEVFSEGFLIEFDTQKQEL